MWTALFRDVLKTEAKLLPQDVALAMTCVKLSREWNNHSRDNLIDIAGYACTVEMIHDRDPIPDEEFCGPHISKESR